jgi:hypothetical protein
MATVESEAFFVARVNAVGISAASLAVLLRLGWSTMANFAFASSYTPGQGDDKEFKDEVLAKVLGAGYDVSVESPRLRRLYFEAHTMSVADLRRRVEKTEDDAPARIPIEERAVRMTKLKARLVGVDI